MDEKLQTLLNNQVISEYGASMVYTQLAFEMDNLSFPGMRDWFLGQAAEERGHAEAEFFGAVDAEADERGRGRGDITGTAGQAPGGAGVAHVINSLGAVSVRAFKPH